MHEHENIHEKINPTLYGARVMPGVDLFAQGFTAKELDSIYYNLTASRHDDGLICEAVGLDEIDAYYNPGTETVSDEFILEAITVARFSRTEKRMAAMVRVLNKHLDGNDEGISALAPVVGKPKKSGTFAYVTVQLPFSDGQTVHVVFHSPEGDKRKIGPDDSLIAFRWILNKRDITHVVAPEDGQEISLESVGKRVTQLVVKNHARFVATQKDAVEEIKALDSLKTAVVDLEEANTGLSMRADDAKSTLETVDARIGNTKARIEKARVMNAELEAEIDALKAKAESKKAEQTAVKKEAGDGGAGSDFAQVRANIKALDGVVFNDEDAAGMEKDGGYAAILASNELSDKWQDVLDHVLSIRVIEVRNALRALGWEGEQYKALSKGGVKLKEDFMRSTHRTNTVGYKYNGILDDLTLSSADFAAKVDAAAGKTGDFVPPSVEAMTPMVDLPEGWGAVKTTLGITYTKATADGSTVGVEVTPREDGSFNIEIVGKGGSERSGHAVANDERNANRVVRENMDQIDKNYADQGGASTDSLPDGWTESAPGRMSTSKDPVSGGIVDKVMLSDPEAWFVVPNDNDLMPQFKDQTFPTRAEAFKALGEAVAAKGGEATAEQPEADASNPRIDPFWNPQKMPGEVRAALKRVQVRPQIGDMPTKFPLEVRRGGHLVMNASRPIQAEADKLWNGEFVKGRFYAAIDPKGYVAAQSIDINRKLDAWLLAYVSEAEVDAWAQRTYGEKLEMVKGEQRAEFIRQQFFGAFDGLTYPEFLKKWNGTEVSTDADAVATDLTDNINSFLAESLKLGWKANGDTGGIKVVGDITYKYSVAFQKADEGDYKSPVVSASVNMYTSEMVNNFPSPGTSEKTEKIGSVLIDGSKTPEQIAKEVDAIVPKANDGEPVGEEPSTGDDQPIRFAPSTNKYSVPMVRGDIVRDGSGKTYMAERLSGFTIEAQALGEDGKPIGGDFRSFNVEPTSPEYKSDLFKTGKNYFDGSEPEPQPEPADMPIQPSKEQIGNPAKRVAKLLYSLGLESQVMKPEFHAKIKNDPYMDLSIETHAALDDGEGMLRIYLTHFIEEGGDLMIDSEMVFLTHKKTGYLKLVETAVRGPRGEYRGLDSTFAQVFSKNLIGQGFDKPKSVAVDGEGEDETTSLPGEGMNREQVQALPIEEFNRIATELENQNFHTEQVLFLAKRYGTVSQIIEAEALVAEHEEAGALTSDISSRRAALRKPLEELWTAENKQSEPNALKSFEDAKKYDVYSTKVRVGDEVQDRYAVRGEHPRGMGDELFDTYEEAKEFSAAKRLRDEANEESRMKQEQKDAEKATREAEEKAKYEADNGFTENMNPLQRGKALKDLNNLIRFDGNTITRKQFIETLVGRGEKTSTREEYKIKEMSRRAFNLATQEEQNAHERKRKEAGMKTVYSVGDYDVTKTEYDYAEYLIANREGTAQPEHKPADQAVPTSQNPAIETLQAIVRGDYAGQPEAIDRLLDEAAEALETAGLFDENEELLNSAADFLTSELNKKAQEVM